MKNVETLKTKPGGISTLRVNRPCSAAVSAALCPAGGAPAKKSGNDALSLGEKAGMREGVNADYCQADFSGYAGRLAG